MISYLKYLFLSTRHPGLADYIDMGLGIEARSKRAQKYWAPHLALCRSMQKQIVNSINGGSLLTILGAGRLLDVDVDSIKEKFDQIRFVDADPACLKKWPTNIDGHQSFIPILSDITGSIDTWNEKLKREINKDSAPSIVEDFFYALTPCKGFDLRISEINHVIFSQNILGQLGIYWRDRAYDHLCKVKGVIRAEDGSLPKGIDTAINYSVQLLEQQHLEILSSSKAKKILVTTDYNYHYYRSDIAEWQTEQALHIGEIEHIKDSMLRCGYEIEQEKTWLWHIAPQGIEHPDYGTIHEVAALSFNLRSQPAQPESVVCNSK